MSTNPDLYTIGYSAFHDFGGGVGAGSSAMAGDVTWTIERFVEVLTERNIGALIDVRSNPYSRMFPEYNKEHLAGILESSGIAYRNYKDGFGAQQDNEAWHAVDANGHRYLDFELFAASDVFIDSAAKVEKGIDLGHTPILMCAENDPVTCHRAILVSRWFHENGYQVEHIYLEGKQRIACKTQEGIEATLMEMFKKQNGSGYIFPDDMLPLFDDTGIRRLSNDEWRRESYRLQNSRISNAES
ncbi:MAG: DUF488 domain-containing protein [Coriobacteriia bacterium]